MPPRMTSPLNAASLSAKPRMAVVTGGMTMPTRGSASKRKTSCRRTGVPRSRPRHRGDKDPEPQPHPFQQEGKRQVVEERLHAAACRRPVEPGALAADL